MIFDATPDPSWMPDGKLEYFWAFAFKAQRRLLGPTVASSWCKVSEGSLMANSGMLNWSSPSVDYLGRHRRRRLGKVLSYQNRGSYGKMLPRVCRRLRERWLD